MAVSGEDHVGPVDLDRRLALEASYPRLNAGKTELRPSVVALECCGSRFEQSSVRRFVIREGEEYPPLYGIGRHNSGEKDELPRQVCRNWRVILDYSGQDQVDLDTGANQESAGAHQAHRYVGHKTIMVTLR